MDRARSNSPTTRTIGTCRLAGPKMDDGFCSRANPTSRRVKLGSYTSGESGRTARDCIASRRKGIRLNDGQEWQNPLPGRIDAVGSDEVHRNQLARLELARYDWENLQRISVL